MVRREASDKSGERPWEVERGDYVLMFFPYPPLEHRRSLKEEIGLPPQEWQELVLKIKKGINVFPGDNLSSHDFSGRLKFGSLTFRWAVCETGFRKRYLNIAGDSKETNWHRAQFCLELPKETLSGRKMAEYRKARDFYQENREAVWCAIFEKRDAAEKAKS